MKKDLVKACLVANFLFRRNFKKIEYKAIDSEQDWQPIHYPNLWRYCAHRMNVAPSTVKSVINSLV